MFKFHHAIWPSLLAMALALPAVSWAEPNTDDELPYGIVIIDWLETSPDEKAPPPTQLYVESLAPIDIEVFEREVYYHEFLSANRNNAPVITE